MRKLLIGGIAIVAVLSTVAIVHRNKARHQVVGQTAAVSLAAA